MERKSESIAVDSLAGLIMNIVCPRCKTGASIEVESGQEAECLCGHSWVPFPTVRFTAAPELKARPEQAAKKIKRRTAADGDDWPMYTDNVLEVFAWMSLVLGCGLFVTVILGESKAGAIEIASLLAGFISLKWMAGIYRFTRQQRDATKRMAAALDVLVKRADEGRLIEQKETKETKP